MYLPALRTTDRTGLQADLTEEMTAEAVEEMTAEAAADREEAAMTAEAVAHRAEEDKYKCGKVLISECADEYTIPKILTCAFRISTLANY